MKETNSDSRSMRSIGFQKSLLIQLICTIFQEDSYLGTSWPKFYIFVQTWYPFGYNNFEWNVGEDGPFGFKEVIKSQ